MLVHSEEIPQEQISVVGENVGAGSGGVDVSTAGPLFTDLHGARACMALTKQCLNLAF